MSVALCLFVAELIVRIFPVKFPKEYLAESFLTEAARTPKDQDFNRMLMYAPHPYFGYTYAPLRGTFHGTLFHRSNSDGFIDHDFPKTRESGICNIGLFGGSGAMSMGLIESDRISTHLQELLNQNNSRKKCRSYRVLNFGIGSHTQFQATAIFLYYASILDGAVFYIGHNECHQAGLLRRSQPIQFPFIDVSSSVTVGHEERNKIFQLKSKIASVATFHLAIQPYLSSRLAELTISSYINSLNNSVYSAKSELSRKVTAFTERSYYDLSKDGGVKYPLSEEEFRESTDTDMQHRAIQKTLPIVFRDPGIHAVAVARRRKISFLAVLQPFPGFTFPNYASKDRRPSSFHAACRRSFELEFLELRKQGGRTLDLNDSTLGSNKTRSFFLDDVHLNGAGTPIVAKVIQKSLLP